MKAKQYDIVVVGAGIHGAGVAQCAAAKGYRVLIVEKTAVAYGTSSRSSKLIHGGLRYLETLQISLVRECLNERTTLLKLAPKLVQLKPFYFPVYTQSHRSPWQLRIGLSLYALLGQCRSSSRFRQISTQHWENQDQLQTTNLKALFQYCDGVTNDVALTEAVIKSACRFGAELIVPAEFSQAQATAEGWNIQYQHNNSLQHCQAKIIINAAGPWVNSVVDKVTPKQSPIAIDLVQGTHIRINHKLKMGIYYLEAPQDRRVVFAIPWGDQTMIGTTETNYHGNPDEVKPLEHEMQYLLDVYKYYFPKQNHLNIDQVDHAFAGLRVLPKSSKSSFVRSRDIILLCDRPRRPRMISIYGGKLTAYRATADKVLGKLSKAYPAPNAQVSTKNIMLE